MKKSIAITGANGFIGQYLVEFFTKKGWIVRKINKSDFNLKQCAPNNRDNNESAIEYTLKSTLPLLEGVDVLIHCAYQKHSSKVPDSRKINYFGTKKLLELAHQASVKSIVYLSSMSAHKDALSEYGISKFENESLFDLKKDIVLRPGLVLGNGGLYFELRNFIRRHKIIPIVGGELPIQTIQVAELVRIISFLLEGGHFGRFFVAEKSGPRLIDFYKEIADYSEDKKIFIKIPISAAKIILQITKWFRVALPFTLENLKGLEKMTVGDTGELQKILPFEISNYKNNISTLERF
jgi:nucleoside-diphosphate-sugar epimerase